MQEYWVYVDDPTDLARVHLGSCRYCNDGQGFKGSRLFDNRWLGPYTDPDEAANAAVRERKRDTKPCGICLKGHRIEAEALQFVIP